MTEIEQACFLNEREGGHILDGPWTCVECGLIAIPVGAEVKHGQIKGGDLDGARTLLVRRR